MKQQGRRCLAYFSGGKTFGKKAKRATNATNHCFYNAKMWKKKQNAYAKQCGKCWQKHAEEASSLCDGAKWTTQEIHHACYCMFIIFYITGTACNSGRRSRCWVGGGVATHYSLHADDVGTTNWHISFCKVFVIMHSKTIVFVRFSWSKTIFS